MVFKAPSYAEKKLTIVVIAPFVALIEDIRKRFEDGGYVISNEILRQFLGKGWEGRSGWSGARSDARVPAILDSNGAGSEVSKDCDR